MSNNKPITYLASLNQSLNDVMVKDERLLSLGRISAIPMAALSR